MKTLIFVFLVLSTPQVIHAASSSTSQSCCDASYSKKKWATCGQIDMSAEALLWRLAIPGFDYVKSSENQIGMLILNKPVYDWGVRVCAGYRFPSCWETKASYLYFKTRFTDTRTSDGNPTLTPLLIFGPGVVPLPQRFASARAEDCFQAVDVSLSSLLISNCYCQFKAFGGARWIDQRGREDYLYIDFGDNANTAFQKTSLCGAGPRFGVWSELWPLPCGCLKGFSVDGSLAASAIIARRSEFFLESANISSTNDNGIRLPALTLIVPALDVNVKANYCFNWECLKWTLYVAYELQWYKNGRGQVSGGSGGQLIPMTDLVGIGYVGWSFGLKASY